jgi:hypothetical protein
VRRGRSKFEDQPRKLTDGGAEIICDSDEESVVEDPAVKVRFR